MKHYRVIIHPRYLLLLWSGLFLCMAFTLPLGVIIVRTLGANQESSFILTFHNYRHLLGFTVKQAGISTICSLLLGLPGAWLLGCCEFPGRRLLKSITTVPFVLPPILAVLGFVLIFGNAGLINLIRREILGVNLPAWLMQ